MIDEMISREAVIRQDVQVAEIIRAWSDFLQANSWQHLIEGVAPIYGTCGIVYELPNYLNRSAESFAIVDVRELKQFEPHYHAGETEIYFILQGTGIVVIGGIEHHVAAGTVLVTPPETAHFIVQHQDLVLAVVNTPPYDFNNHKALADTDRSVKFDREQFDRLK